MANERVPANSAAVFPVALTIDGAVWNLTGATVTLLVRDGAGNITEHAATVTSAVAGEAECELGPDDLALSYHAREWEADQASRWSRSWRVIQSGDDQRSLPIPFTVVYAP